MLDFLFMIGLTIIQNASFTLVSRARNSKSIKYHAIAVVISSIVWLMVIKNLIANFDRTDLMIAYVLGSVIGSIAMHYIAMKYLEKP